MAEKKTETKPKPKTTGKKPQTKKSTQSKKKQQAAVEKNKGGRPAKYEQWLQPDNLEKIKDLRRNGATLEDVAHMIHVTTTTVKDWQKRFPTFSAAMKEAEIYDDQAEQVLHTLGVCGWVTQDITEELRLNPETGKEELMVVKRVTKQIPPQTSALIFWLKNRRPDKWRDKREIIDQFEEENYCGTIEIPAVMQMETPADEE